MPRSKDEAMVIEAFRELEAEHKGFFAEFAEEIKALKPAGKAIQEDYERFAAENEAARLAEESAGADRTAAKKSGADRAAADKAPAIRAAAKKKADAAEAPTKRAAAMKPDVAKVAATTRKT